MRANGWRTAVLLAGLAWVVGACGSDGATSPDPVLPTEVHADGGFITGWPQAAGSVLVNRSWRFFTAEAVESGLEVTGGYVITWWNATPTPLTVEFESVVFEDADGATVTRFDLLPEPVRFELAVNQQMERQGSFIVLVPDLAAASSIVRLRLAATFTEM